MFEVSPEASTGVSATGSGSGGDHQSISQKNTANQKSNIVTGGANSGVTNSGNNAAVQSNANSGGNAAVH